MSDATITAEEREMWASTAAARINAVTPERQCEITAQERLVKSLKALEQAEARVKSRNNHIHRLLGEALESERNLDGMKSRLQEAEARAEKAEAERKKDLMHCKYEFERAEDSEADVARLTKERDWLAVELGNALIDPCLVEHLRDLGGMSPPDPEKLKEAARRAVAAGEE